MARGLTIKIRTAWWLPIYCKAIVWTYAITGRDPDWGKVERVIKRAMRLTLNGVTLSGKVAVLPPSSAWKPAYPPMQDEYYERKG